jgi:hypothetical protein
MNNYRKIDNSRFIQSDCAAKAVLELFDLDLSKDACFSVYENGRMMIVDYYPAELTGSMFVHDFNLTPHYNRWYSVCKESGDVLLSSDDQKKVLELEEMCQMAAKKRGM